MSGIGECRGAMAWATAIRLPDEDELGVRLRLETDGAFRTVLHLERRECVAILTALLNYEDDGGESSPVTLSLGEPIPCIQPAEVQIA